MKQGLKVEDQLSTPKTKSNIQFQNQHMDHLTKTRKTNNKSCKRKPKREGDTIEIRKKSTQIVKP